MKTLRCSESAIDGFQDCGFHRELRSLCFLQLRSGGGDPETGGSLALGAFKDVEAAHGETNVLLGKGVARIPEVMEELRRQKFSGLVAIEYGKEGNVEEDMRQDVEIARELA